jgi:hypothetical protein
VDVPGVEMPLTWRAIRMVVALLPSVASAKKVENVVWAVSLHFMHYNFARSTRRLKTTRRRQVVQALIDDADLLVPALIDLRHGLSDLIFERQLYGAASFRLAFVFARFRLCQKLVTAAMKPIVRTPAIKPFPSTVHG